MVVNVTTPVPQNILQVGNVLGECVLWDSRHNELWWTDIQASRLHCCDWTTGALQTLEAPERIGSFGIANGLCFSPDGSQLYFADSPTRVISAYELIEPDGVLGSRRTLAQTPEGSSPDGATVDVDGCIWTALWGAGCVVRYTPDGRLDRTLPVPASQPTCVCFAGPKLDILCVTSAKAGLDDTRLHDEPHAGDVFLYRVGTQGLPESEYRA